MRIIIKSIVCGLLFASCGAVKEDPKFIFKEVGESVRPKDIVTSIEIDLLRHDEYQGFRIDKIVSVNDYLLIADYEFSVSFALLDQNLQVINAIKRFGEGPGEFKEIYDIAFDEKYISLIAAEKILYFDTLGNFSHEKAHSYFIDNLEFLDGFMAVHTLNRPMKEAHKNIHLLNGDFEIVNEWLPYSKKEEFNVRESQKNFYWYDSALRYVPSVATSVYSIDKFVKPELLYQFNFVAGNHDVFEQYGGAAPDFTEYLLGGDFVWGVDNCIETDSLIFLTAYQGAESHLYLAYKNRLTLHPVEITSLFDVLFLLANTSYTYLNEYDKRIYSFVEADFILNLVEGLEGEEKAQLMSYLDLDQESEINLNEYSIACLSFLLK